LQTLLDGVAAHEGSQLQNTMKIIGYVVLALMAAGIVYANVVGFAYWAGIGV
jgi:hypothetical protein